MRLLIVLALSIAWTGFAHFLPSNAGAHEYEVGAITIEHPTVTPPPAGRDATAGYMTLINRGRAPDRLVSVASPLAQRVEIHETRVGANGVAEMRALPGGLLIPANGRAVLSPGGLHLMITGLRQPLRRGDALSLTLHFEHAGRIEILASVERPSSGTHDQHRSGHMH